MTDLAFAGLARQAELLRAGEVSSRELVELYLERIARLDVRLRAYRVVLAEAALAEADAADARRAAGGDVPPLNGVPIAIKDDTDVAGQVTMRGSLAHSGEPCAEDSVVVARLRAAGCVILGKTHVPELEAMCATESLAFGATVNPWDPARTSGGSSGGSGTAVAAGLAAAALGTDGAGSIRIPSAACGLFGLKPQRDRLPMRVGWNGLSVTGCLTRGVRDTALFGDAAAGTDWAGAAAREPGRLRIAVSLKVPRGIIVRVEEEQRTAVLALAERLRRLGHEVFEREPDYGNAGPRVLARYLHGVRTEAEAMAHPDRLSRKTRGLARLGRRVPGPLVRRALALEEADRARANEIFDHADVVIMPVLTRRPPLAGEWDDLPAPVMLNGMVNFTAFLGFWNHTGQPAASVPSEVAADGFPVGVQLVGRPGDEATLLSLAAQLEADSGWAERRPPLAA
jgi:amidase